MRRNTAKIFFVVYLFLQGTNSTKAVQALSIKVEDNEQFFYSKIERPDSSYKVKQSWFLKTIFKEKKLGRSNQSKIKKGEFLLSNLIIKEHLSNLDSPLNLALPQSSSDITNQHLYPLKLKDLENLVEANNPKLEISRERIKQQEYNLKKAISAWYPIIEMNTGPQYLQGESYNDSYADTSSKQWKTTLSVEVNWNLIDPKRAPEIAAAQNAYEKAKKSYLIELRDLQFEVKNAYFLLQNSDEGVRIGKESVNASKISLNDAQARLKAGLGTRLELLEAKTQLARDKRLLTQKIGEQKVKRRALATILNLPFEITPIADSPQQIIGEWTASLEQSIIAAYSFRNELDNIKLDIAINNSNANAALGNSQPRLSVYNIFSNDYTRGELASLDKDGSSTNNTFGLKATWRIFDGNNARSRYNYNKQIAKASAAEFANKRNTIRQEVEEDYIQLKTANQDILSSTREVAAARESLRLARLRFKEGITTQREVVNNQRDLTQAEVGYYEAITSYNTSISRLHRRTGINYIKDCKSLNKNTGTDKEIDPANLPIEQLQAITPCPQSPIIIKE